MSRSLVGHYARSAAGLTVSLAVIAVLVAWVGLGALLDDAKGEL
jgi:nucleoside permease NupC